MKIAWQKFNLTGFYYALFLLLLIVIANGQTAGFRRLNSMMEWSEYPAQVLRNGNTAVSDRQLRLAIRYYRTLTHLFPQLARGYGIIGFCYYYLDDFHKARQYYLKAKTVDLNIAEFDYDLGIINYRLGEHELAMDYLAKVLERQGAVFTSAEGYSLFSDELKRSIDQLSASVSQQMIINSLKIIAMEKLINENPAAAEDDRRLIEARANPSFDLVFHPMMYLIPLGQEELLKRQSLR